MSTLNVMMLTNTYKPHVGGVANSVDRLTQTLRSMGHRAVVVAPEFEEHEDTDPDVIRMPAIQKFHGSDFAMTLPVLSIESTLPEGFQPQILHSHHPFLLGDTALRLGARKDVPIVFTYHTMYEKYTHYVPGDSETMKKFVITLSKGYADMVDQVIAPSESVKKILREREITSPITVIPTGLDTESYKKGDRKGARKRWGLPENAFVTGHLGRLAPEKNLEFLARAVTGFLRQDQDRWFLVAGEGPSTEAIQTIAAEAGTQDRLVLTGSLEGQDVIDAYHAMDLFAFSSKSETQGMVLTEAMSAGVPVVALDASGVREVVRDEENGRLLQNEDEEEFAKALAWCQNRLQEDCSTFTEALRQIAEEHSLEATTNRTLDVYREALTGSESDRQIRQTEWQNLLDVLGREWDLWSNRMDALGSALLRKEEESPAD